jgi:hypothetical protein
LSSDEALPETLGPQQVQEAMAPVTALVARCGVENRPTKLRVEMSIGNQGHVLWARPERLGEDGWTGWCAANMVCTAELPRFQKDEIDVKYPFLVHAKGWKPN